MNKQGLTTNEVKQLQKKHGLNQLPEPKRQPLIMRFFAALTDFMTLTLLVAAFISAGVTYLKGDTDYIDSMIILAIVIINTALSVYQETKAEHSLAALKKMTAPFATVIRDGKKQRVDTISLVPGDVVMLTSGNFVPGDGKIISGFSLSTEESALTGESQEIDKTPGDLIYSGTTIVTGHGTAVLTATGSHTEMGKIASFITYAPQPMTLLQRRLGSTGKVLGIMAFLICLVIFFVGILESQPVFPMFMTAVSLAVAAVPEGLAAIVTIMLALGVERMVKRGALIRRLSAVETLGSATVICSDKTGTLTVNQMKVCKVFTSVSCHEDRLNLARLGMLCNNSMSGVEQAFLTWGKDWGLHLSEEQATHPRIDELPFDSTRKKMTTLHQDGTRFLSITKGAPESILDSVDSYYENGVILPLNSQVRRRFANAAHEYTTSALRVLAVSFRQYDKKPSRSSLENKLTLAGLVGFMDPPRKEAIASIKECKRAGIRPVMITGDHALTAAAIGKELGILGHNHQVLTGSTLQNLSEEELNRTIYDYPVIARVTPGDKVRIVKAFQSHGEVVAMTGDGVNDAPALKIADIGCAMGRCGTDVAKNAADMVLTDDNFATIVAAVEEGRGIYDNIKKAIYFLLSCNIGEIMTIFVAILMGFASPLLPVQLLFINLITDSFPAICLGLEPPEPDIMTRPPHGRSSFFSPSGIFQIVIEGMFIGSLALFAYATGGFGETGRTMCFAVLALSQLVHSFNMRSSKSVLELGLTGNPKLLASILLCIGLQILVIVLPPLQPIFHTVFLGTWEWAFVLFLSLLPLPLVELQKKFRQKNN